MTSHSFMESMVLSPPRHQKGCRAVSQEDTCLRSVWYPSATLMCTVLVRFMEWRQEGRHLSAACTRHINRWNLPERHLSATYELILPSRRWLCPEVVALNEGHPKECCSWTAAAVFWSNLIQSLSPLRRTNISEVTSLREPVTKVRSPVVQSTARCGQLMVRASMTRCHVLLCPRRPFVGAARINPSWTATLTRSLFVVSSLKRVSPGRSPVGALRWLL